MLRRSVSLLALTLALGACEKPMSWGDQHAIIVATSTDRWAEVEDIVEAALEPEILTVRREGKFRVSHQDPAGEDWIRLKRFRQMLTVGSQNDPVVAEALAESDESAFRPPQIVQVEDVWARGQLVTVLLTRDGQEAADAEILADSLQILLDTQYRQWTYNRMFQSGRDTALADTLWRDHGFAVVVPEVYYWRRETDSIFIFRNDNPDPAELIRQVTVSWKTPVPEEPATQNDILAWRTELSDNWFSYPQAIDLTLTQDRRLQLGDIEMNELRAAWSNPPDDSFPAGGPFMIRWFECPAQDRLYLVDAWLYSPDPERSKYQYLIQLETILNSFRCNQS